MFWISGGLIVLSLVLWYFIHDKKKGIYSITMTPKRNVNEILGSSGSGTFQTAKVRGRVVCDEPLHSELTNTECVFYEMEVVRKYKTTKKVEENGQTRMKTETHTSRISHNIRQAPFYLDDGTGRIKISMQDAEFEKEQVLCQFVPSQGNDTQINFGNFSFNLSGFLGSEQTLGYEYREWAIPVNKEILVIGGIKKEDEPYFTLPEDDRFKYIISFLQESELIKSFNSQIFWLKVTTVITLASGISALIYGLIEKGILKS